jgi:hypothetical protein
MRRSCPTIDVAFHRERGECWMLMDDVSAGFAPRHVERSDASTSADIDHGMPNMDATVPVAVISKRLNGRLV